MKYFAIVICLLFGKAAQSFSQSETMLVKISDLTPKQISRLVRQDINVFRLDKNNKAHAYVTARDFENLAADGYNIKILPDVSKIYADSLWLATKSTSNPMGAYHTFEELSVELQSLVQQYPDICLLQSIGKSVLGHDLWFMKISDNVTMEEAEPEFKYISTMHGNEPVGMEMCLYFINYLLENYGQDSLITRLVDETEIWIMPLMNPDGYIARRRWNNNDIDLNRNFPDRIDDPINSVVGRQPETQAVMNFGFDHSFVLSANFHTGALVVNYPYDSNANGYSVYTATPDDDLFVEVAKTYSAKNLPMWNSLSFENGITNGAEWYVIYGGMQDWNYVWQGCNDLTVELSDMHWPDDSTLVTFWENNRESMLAYLEAVHWGVRGVISDSLFGLPLAATIEVAGRNYKVYSDPDLGDYYRMLLPGVYSLNFSADGYISKQIDSISVLQNKATRLDVQLMPSSTHHISGTVVNSISGMPVKAQLEFKGNQGFFAETGEDGAFQLVLPHGRFQVKIASDVFMSETDSIDVFEDCALHYELVPAVFLFNSDFENDNGLFKSMDTLWQWGEPGFGPLQAGSGEKVWGTSLNSSYPNLADAVLLMPEIILPNAERIELSFNYWIDAETDPFYPGTAYDGGIVEITSDSSGNWMQMYPIDGYSFTIPDFIDSGPFVSGTKIYSGSRNWKKEKFDLADFKGLKLQLRFHFGSDKDNVTPLAGWYLDDVAIKYPDSRSNIRSENLKKKQISFSLSQNYPNPFNNSTMFTYSVKLAGNVKISIYNLRGQLIKTLLNQHIGPGMHKIQWAGFDSFGHPVASGIYVIQLENKGQFLTRKIVLMK